MSHEPARHDDGKGALLRHAMNYFASHAALVLLNLISIPIFTRLLMPGDYGLFQTFNSYVAIGSVLLTLNAASAVTRRLLEGRGPDDSFLASALSFPFLTIFAVATVALPFRDIFAGWLGVSPTMLYLLFPAMLFAALFSTFHAYSVATRNSKRYSLVSVARGYGGVLLGVAIVFALSAERHLGPILGNVVASGVAAIWLTRTLSRQCLWNPNPEHFGYMISYSLPLMFFSLGNILLGQLDRVMINKMIGPAEAGIYSLAYNVGMLLDMVSTALHSALIPYWFKHLNEGQRASADSLAEFNYRITLCFALALICFSQELLRILASRAFQDALAIIPVIVIGYIFNSVYKIYLREVSYSKRLWHVSLIAVVGALVNWGLNLWLLPVYGYKAAAYTTLTSFLLMATMAWLIVRRVLRIEAFPLVQLFLPTLVFLLGIVGYYGTVLYMNGGWLALLAKLIITIAVAIVLLKKNLCTAMQVCKAKFS